MIHVVKRKEMPLAQSLGIRLGVIVLALVVCGVITALVTGLNPIDVYGTMIQGSFGSPRKVWILLQEVALLLCVSLALTPAFRMKFWNLGGEGQVLAGALACAACMILLGGSLPSAALILVMLVASLAAGALWAAIPAFFKAVFNTNETLFTLMMNYVATQLVAYFVIVWENPKGSGTIGVINQSSQAGWLPVLFGNKYLLIVVLVALLTAGMYVYLNYSKQGYEISVVGESPSTARYVGIKVNKVIVRTLLISGAVCGFAGMLLVGGSAHTLSTSIAAGRGFTGVMVAWLAKFNPAIMVASSFLLEFMSYGAGEIATTYGLNASFGDILTGIILFFIIGTEFFITYRVVFQKKEEVASDV
ncbi:MAG: ABC transporter permease [Coriobacteriales bacterium]|nr:ABC transporter permease [Coriobacteriales bacterium]